MSRVRTSVLVLVGGVVILVGSVVWVGSRVQSPEQAAARAAEPVASWVTAAVELRVLSATVITRGDVRPEVAVSVGLPSSIDGAGVVTALGVALGDDVAEGARVVEVSGRPVFVLGGDVPVYRSLRPGMNGADVGQLQAALLRLGYKPESDGVFGEATKRAVAEWYAAAGYEPVPSSPRAAAEVAAAEQSLIDARLAADTAGLALLKAGEGPPASAVAQATSALSAAERNVVDAKAQRESSVAEATAALRAARDQRARVFADPTSDAAARDEADLAVTRAINALASARRVGEGSIASAVEQAGLAKLQLTEVNKPADLTEPKALFDSAIAQRTAAEVALAAVKASTGPTVAQGEVVFVPSLPARVLSVVSSLGAVGSADGGPPGEGGGGGDGSLVRLAAGRLVVSMMVRPSDAGLVRPGMALVLLDELSNSEYPATVASVSADAVTRPDGQTGFPAIITPDAELPAALAGANIRVTITAASTQTESLVVPLAAVSSGADGNERVSVLGGEGTDPVDVAVTAGISADGFVAIEPVKAGSLKAGDRVVVGR